MPINKDVLDGIMLDKDSGAYDRAAKESQAERLAMFERTLAAQGESVAEFDSQLWASMVECVTVEVNSSMTVVFRDGTERRL